MFTSDRREDGGQGWWTDYPDADINFSIRLSELTKTRVSRSPDGEPNHLVVRLTDDELFQCPFIEMEDVGTRAVQRRRGARGCASTCSRAASSGSTISGATGPGAQWVEEIAARAAAGGVPDPSRPDRSIPSSARCSRCAKLPQIPSIAHWRRSGGGTSERGEDSAVPQMYAISDAHGRMMVLMTHNTDISDAWEREGEDPRFFYQFSPNGYAVGINVVLYTMTH